jgi:hypothetical protein
MTHANGYCRGHDPVKLAYRDRVSHIQWLGEEK